MWNLVKITKNTKLENRQIYKEQTGGCWRQGVEELREEDEGVKGTSFMLLNK